MKERLGEINCSYIYISLSLRKSQSYI